MPDNEEISFCRPPGCSGVPDSLKEQGHGSKPFDRLGGVVIIPTYNNAGTIADVIHSVKEHSGNILVVNDGSTDSTSEILAATSGIGIIEYRQNKGKGHALKLALREAAGKGFRYAITIDSDGQHYADDIPAFIRRIEKQPDSLLIGSRNLAAENMPSGNSFANKFSNFWFMVETGIKLTDTQSGYRLYPLRKIKAIKTVTPRYEFEVEIIVRAAWRGVKIANVPIKVFYAPEGERVSHFRPLRDFTRISILNTFLVLAALLYHYPLRFFRSLNGGNIKKFVRDNITHSKESNTRLACSMGLGVFCGIIPIWGYQMIFAGITAHLMKLNKVVALVFSNISIPPMIPPILYASFITGGAVTGGSASIKVEEVSFEVLGESLLQYIIGSIFLAFIAGSLTFLAGWLLMTVFKRKPENESNDLRFSN